MTELRMMEEQRQQRAAIARAEAERLADSRWWVRIRDEIELPA